MRFNERKEVRRRRWSSEDLGNVRNAGRRECVCEHSEMSSGFAAETRSTTDGTSHHCAAKTTAEEVMHREQRKRKTDGKGTSDLQRAS